MTTMNRILSIVLSSFLLILIIELVRRGRLKEKYAILWIFLGVSVFLLAAFPNLLTWLTKMLGITLPINTVFFFGIFFIILINLHFSLVISNLSEQNIKIAQKLSLLETKLKGSTKDT